MVQKWNPNIGSSILVWADKWQNCVDRYLHLPLVDAERCWAYAMQLKSEANTEPRKRFHMMSRLKKAVGHAELLAFLCEIDKCDARTKTWSPGSCIDFVLWL